MANTTGLGDTIYAAVKKALEDAEGSSGGSGGGGSATMDVYLWNGTDDLELMTVLPTKVEYLSGVNGGVQQYSEIAFTEITETVEIQGTPVTFHGIKLTDAPAGARLHITLPDDYTVNLVTGYAEQSDAVSVFTSVENFLGETVPMLLEGMVAAGIILVFNTFEGEGPLE